MLPSIRAVAALLVLGASVVAACGGKTAEPIVEAGPPAPPSSATEAGPPPNEPFDAGGRTCTSTCASPHQCCQNGCGGLPAAMPSSCCTCLPNEVSSETCTNNKCGG